MSDGSLLLFVERIRIMSDGSLLLFVNVRFAYTKPLLFRASILNGGREGLEG